MKKLLLAAAFLAAPVLAHAAPETAEAKAAPSGAVNPAEGDGVEPGGGEPADEVQDPSQYFNFFDFGYRGKDETNGAYGDGTMDDTRRRDHQTVTIHDEEAKSPPFILMVVNFALLLGLLAWKGAPVASQYARERHDQIKTALDEAAKLREQAAEKLREYETRLKSADAEIDKMVEGMRADAEADKRRILAAAEAQAVAMQRDAEARIAAEIDAARAQLTREVTAAAVSATDKLLREKVTPADQAAQVTAFLGGLQTATRKENRS
ncbi:MAG TPA: ATP synthase F0 subunit B [Kofleriaceae bacterium]|jgi:F-type H+-transporting ATPase subunit b